MPGAKDMLGSEAITARIDHLEDGQQCLPQMTALFVEGLSKQNSHRAQSVNHFQNQAWFDANAHGFAVSFPPTHRITKNEITSYCTRIEKPSCENRQAGSDRELETLRLFICGISNCFNNILMGIWGNVSLLSLTIDTSHPVRAQVLNIDRLIQNGALLIHSLFGYMAERRMATKHLRLVQLVQEINARIHNPEIALDIHEIEKGMERASFITRPSEVAESMAPVLDQLLRWIEGQLQSARAVTEKEVTVVKKLNTIDGLLKRGHQLVRQLNLHTGNQQPQLRTLSTKSLVERQARQSIINFRHVQISVAVSDQLKPLTA
jgi:hypothetical protein